MSGRQCGSSPRPPNGFAEACSRSSRSPSFRYVRGGARVDAGEDREYSRQPRPEDLTKICPALNREGARYILIGGFAVIARGLERPTKDIATARCTDRQ